MENKEEFYLMHKDIVVCQLFISSNGEMTLGMRNINGQDHFPIGGRLNSTSFSRWWKNRYIPENRDGIKKALKIAGYESAGNALVDNLALSLTDCYWIKPKDSSLTWKDVNLYENDFIDVIGDALFTGKTSVKKTKNKYNVASSSGELKKKWCIDKDNKRILIKGNLGKSYQQSLNEVFISKIHQQLNEKYALSYELIDINIDKDRTIIGCKSIDFCNSKVEFISASEIVDGRKLKGSDNPFDCFRQGCIELGMKEKDFDDYMDYLILTDCLFTNVDRHLNNIGILRDPDTLKLIGFSPIFDSGNSMFYDYTIEQLKKINLKEIKANSFFNTEKKMLNHVKNVKIINLDAIKVDFSIYDKDIKEEKNRYDIIKKLFYQKLEMLKEYQRRH